MWVITVYFSYLFHFFQQTEEKVLIAFHLLTLYVGIHIYIYTNTYMFKHFCTNEVKYICFLLLSF